MFDISFLCTKSVNKAQSTYIHYSLCMGNKKYLHQTAIYKAYAMMLYH